MRLIVVLLLNLHLLMNLVNSGRAATLALLWTLNHRQSCTDFFLHGNLLVICQFLICDLNLTVQEADATLKMVISGGAAQAPLLPA